MSTDFRALCAELAAELDHNRRCLLDDASLTHPLADRARAALAEQVAEPPAVTERPSDEDILELMPQQFRNDLATVSRMAASGAGPDVTPGLFRVTLNTGALDFARAVLARWGRPTPPAPPADGEIDQLVSQLRDYAQGEADNGWHDDAARFRRAAELLERHAAPVPVPVAERLPEPNTKVLAHYFNDHGKGRTICAIWVPAGSRECTGDDSISEPVEGCWPEGWYELIENWNWEDYGWIAVNEGEVAYWQPLPKWPAHALPLPAPQGGEVEP